MRESGHPKLVLWDNAEGCGGRGVGGGLRMVGHMYTHGWFMVMYGKNCHCIFFLNNIVKLASN